MVGRGQPKVLAVVLAGGEGKRLMPLTADRAKPAVPFGGIFGRRDEARMSQHGRGDHRRQCRAGHQSAAHRLGRGGQAHETGACPALLLV